MAMIKRCVFICTNKTNGCTAEIPYDEMAQHQMTCPFELIKCSGFKLCNMMCLRMDLYAHESLCPYSNINKDIDNGNIEANISNLTELVNNLIVQIKRQDDEIKELKNRLEKVEDKKEAG